MPCITTDCPWQPYFFGRKRRSGQGLRLDLSFLLGPRGRHRRLPGAVGPAAPTNKVVGGLFPNDADGNAWGDPERGLPPALAAGRLQADRSRPLPAAEQRLHRRRSRAFKAASAEIVTGIMIPPDFATFWSAGGAAGLQAEDRHHRQGAAVPVGDRVARRRAATASPPKSGGRRTIRSSRASPARARAGADRRLYRRDQAAVDAADRLPARAVRSRDRRAQARRRPRRAEARSSMRSPRPTTTRSSGRCKWTGQPVKNVTKTPLVAGQWQRKGDKFDLVITTNKTGAGNPGRRAKLDSCSS